MSRVEMFSNFYVHVQIIQLYALLLRNEHPSTLSQSLKHQHQGVWRPPYSDGWLYCIRVLWRILIHEIESVSKLSKPSGQNPQRVPHIGILSWYRVAGPHSWYWGGGEAGCGFSFFLPLPPETEGNRKFGSNDHIYFSLTLDPSYPHQLC